MSSTHSANPPNFPEDAHFDGTNYIGFKSRVLIAARARGARGYLEGTIKRPENPTTPSNTVSPVETKDVAQTDSKATEWSSTTPSAEEWDERDAWALGLIVYNSKNPVGLGITMDGTAADAWKTLNDNYGTASEIAALNAERRLRATELAEGADFLKHVEDLREKWKSATEKGATVNDATFRNIVIASLPESWNAVVAGLYTMTTSKDVIAALTTHWDRIVSQKQKAGTSTMALLTKTNPQKPRLVCSNVNCGRTGHTIENCYWRGGGKEGQFPPNFRNRNRNGNTTLPSNNTPAQNNSQTPSANAVAIPHSTDPSSHVTYALAAIVEVPSDMVVANAAKTREIPTYADSDATDHFFVERSEFCEYETLPTPIEGNAAPKAATFRVIGRGTIKKTCCTSQGMSELVFTNALHAPDLSSNLISINKFDNAGFDVIFGGGKVRFHDAGGREVMVGEGTGGMYLILSFDTPSAMVAKSQVRAATLETWHRRFGHASVKTIRDVLAMELVDGLYIKGPLTVSGVCEDCVYGKHTSRPYDGEVEVEAHPNQRVHIDLWGPASVISLGGASYMLVVVDGGTSHITVYFLARKDSQTTLSALTTYHAESERQTGRKLLEIRVDAGREWVNELWTAYLAQHGILLKVTTPYAHAQNGVAERANRTIVEGVRCMLAESGLPKFLWAEAAVAQVYTRNMLPSSRHPGLIPNTTWNGSRQHVDHLQAWGCVAWAKVPEELVRSKLDPRSLKVRLVGYSTGGYRLFDQASRSVITSRDVIFEEGVGHRAITDFGSGSKDSELRIAPTPPLNDPTTPGIVPNCQPIAPRVPTGPLHDAATTDRDHDPRAPIEPASIPQTSANTRNPDTTAPRRSTRLVKPTPAIVAARESNERKAQARATREEWATGEKPPLALTAGSPYTYLATFANYVDDMDGSYVPRTYSEAMKRPDLWQPAMDEELKVMMDRGVFELVDEASVPAGKNIVGCRWVYVVVLAKLRHFTAPGFACWRSPVAIKKSLI